MKLKILLSFIVVFGISINGYTQTFNNNPDKETIELNSEFVDCMISNTLENFNSEKKVILMIYANTKDNNILRGDFILEKKNSRESYHIVANCYKKELKIKTELYICIYLDNAKKGYPILAKYKVTYSIAYGSNYNYKKTFSCVYMNPEISEFKDIELTYYYGDRKNKY